MFDYLLSDLKRFSSGHISIRTIVRGLLSQGFQAILIYRFFRWLKVTTIPSQPFRFFCERIIEITTGISIPVECKIGKGFRIHHFGGIIFHPTVKIGENCTIYHGVTIGDKGGYGGAAIIGNNVMIGAGAKIIGEITIGNNCKIGANCVVDKNMPDNYIAYGNPMTLKKRKNNLPYGSPMDKSFVYPVRIMELRGTYKGGGGPDKTILLSAEKHNKKQFFVLVTYLRSPDDNEFQIDEMAKNRGITYTDVFDRTAIDFKCIFKLHKLIALNNIQILHAHDDKSSLYGLFLKMLNPGLKIMYTCHLYKIYTLKDTGGYIDYINHWIRRKIALNIMKFYSFPLIAVSMGTKKMLIQEDLKESRIKVILNSIDYTYWRKNRSSSTFRKEYNLHEKTFIIGLIGRLGYDKDLPAFLKVAKIIVSTHKNTKFILVGEGRTNEMDSLKKQCITDKIEKSIIFTGFRTDLKNIYSSLDLFLMTSTAEGLPNTVLEAMSMEVPVVSTSVDGIPELVIDGKTGFLCNPGDITSLAEKLMVLINDKETRKRFSIESRKRIKEEFSFDKRLEIIEEYYVNLKTGSTK